MEYMLLTLRTFLLDSIFQDMIENVTCELSYHHVYNSKLSGLHYDSRIDRLHE